MYISALGAPQPAQAPAYNPWIGWTSNVSFQYILFYYKKVGQC